MIFFYNGLCAIAIKRQIRAKKFMVWSVVALEGILSGGQVVAARWRGSSSAWIALCLRTMRAITLYELRSNLFNFFKGSRMQNSGVPDLRIFSTEFKQRFVFLFFEQCVLQKKSNKVHIFWEVHKFCKISTLDLTECTVVKVEISQNFVAFSEYIYELYIIFVKVMYIAHRNSNQLNWEFLVCFLPWNLLYPECSQNTKNSNRPKFT